MPRPPAGPGSALARRIARQSPAIPLWGSQSPRETRTLLAPGSGPLIQEGRLQVMRRFPLKTNPTDENGASETTNHPNTGFADRSDRDANAHQRQSEPCLSHKRGPTNRRIYGRCHTPRILRRHRSGCAAWLPPMGRRWRPRSSSRVHRHENGAHSPAVIAASRIREVPHQFLQARVDHRRRGFAQGDDSEAVPM